MPFCFYFCTMELGNNHHRIHHSCKYSVGDNLFLKTLAWVSENFTTYTALNSNDSVFSGTTRMPLNYINYNGIIACGEVSRFVWQKNGFDGLDAYISKKQDWIFGAVSYDIKNEIEQLTSSGFDNLNFPILYFYQPEIVFIFKNGRLDIHCHKTVNLNIKNLCVEIFNYALDGVKLASVATKKRISSSAYFSAVKKLQHRIKIGDIYEANFCQEFYSEEYNANPFMLYRRLNQINPSPFSCFSRMGEKFIISASPERFIKKTGDVLLSQPMKGTMAKHTDPVMNTNQIHKLQTNEKERAENIMITDLVRNDLSKLGRRGTVKVTELCGVYSFPRVLQMITTIQARAKPGIFFGDVLKSTFPMGSMTGAPKIRAMQLIDEAEVFKRGMFSGSVGYITPSMDFDFNVLIRTILLNQNNNYLNFITGSAITASSDPEQEYQESLLKAAAMFEVISGKVPV